MRATAVREINDDVPPKLVQDLAFLGRQLASQLRGQHPARSIDVEALAPS
jgi:hypothetical protein